VCLGDAAMDVTERMAKIYDLAPLTLCVLSPGDFYDYDVDMESFV